MGIGLQRVSADSIAKRLRAEELFSKQWRFGACCSCAYGMQEVQCTPFEWSLWSHCGTWDSRLHSAHISGMDHLVLRAIARIASKGCGKGRSEAAVESERLHGGQRIGQRHKWSRLKAAKRKRDIAIVDKSVLICSALELSISTLCSMP
jgi:hypothetical protein